MCCQTWLTKGTETYTASRRFSRCAKLNLMTPKTTIETPVCLNQRPVWSRRKKKKKSITTYDVCQFVQKQNTHYNAEHVHCPPHVRSELQRLSCDVRPRGGRITPRIVHHITWKIKWTCREHPTECVLRVVLSCTSKCMRSIACLCIFY